MTSQPTQNDLVQAQAYQQQIQGILLQKENISLQLAEIKKALDEITKTTETEVFKMSGPILIKSTKNTVKKELTQSQELLNLRLKTLEKTEKKAKEMFQELRDKLTNQ